MKRRISRIHWPVGLQKYVNASTFNALAVQIQKSRWDPLTLVDKIQLEVDLCTKATRTQLSLNRLLQRFSWRTTKTAKVSLFTNVS